MHTRGNFPELNEDNKVHPVVIKIETPGRLCHMMIICVYLSVLRDYHVQGVNHPRELLGISFWQLKKTLHYEKIPQSLH